MPPYSNRHCYYYQKTKAIPKKKKNLYLNQNILIISNIPTVIYNKDILYRYEYFGQYGNITSLNLFLDNTNSCAISYSLPSEAAIAFLCLNEAKIYNNQIYISYKTSYSSKKKVNGIILNKKTIFDYNKFALERAKVNDNEIVAGYYKQCLHKRTIFPSPVDFLVKYNTDNNNHNEIQRKKSSRFEFAKSDKEIIDEIPKFITDIINKKYLFERLLQKGEYSNIHEKGFNNTKIDELLCHELIAKDNTNEKNWANFVFHNLNSKLINELNINNNLINTYTNDSELISDIDNINNFILGQISLEI